MHEDGCAEISQECAAPAVHQRRNQELDEHWWRFDASAVEFQTL